MKTTLKCVCVLTVCLLIASVNYAQMYATIGGLKDGSNVKKSELLKNNKIQVSDSTFKVLSFEVSFKCGSAEDSWQLINFVVDGSKFSDSQHELEKSISGCLLNGDKIYIENIVAIKNGEKVKLSSVNLKVTE